MKKEVSIKEEVFTRLRHQAEQLVSDRAGTGNSPTKQDEMSVLLSELEIHELELQMQNEELKSSHLALEMERTKFENFFNAAPVGYLILNKKGNIVEINPVATTLLQGTPGAVMGKNFSNYLVSDSRHEYQSFLEDLVHAHNKGTCELRLKTRDHQTLFVRVDGSVAIYPIEDHEAFYITITDITSTKKNQQELLETSVRLNQILQLSNTGTWQIHPDINLVVLDKYSRRILEIDSELKSLNFQALTALIYADDRAVLSQVLANEKQTEIDLELRFDTSKGRKTILVKGQAVNPLDGERYFTGMLIDITLRQQNLEIEEEMQRAQQRMLRRAAIYAQEKERSKISSTLHDSVCQTLYGIRFSLSHIQRSASDVPLTNINNLLDQAIKELRTLSVELTPSILKDFGFSAGLKDMIQRLEQSGFKVSVNLDRKVDTLAFTTQLYIFRIIQELLNNSIKHSGSNHAKVSIGYIENEICIKLCDYGRGFQTDLDQAFLQGSGLRGIKNRVSLLKGKIKISNDEGANFEISFPVEH